MRTGGVGECAMVLPGPFGFSKVVFLSHVLTASGPTFPGDPPVEIRGGLGSPATVFGLVP